MKKKLLALLLMTGIAATVLLWRSNSTEPETAPPWIPVAKRIHNAIDATGVLPTEEDLGLLRQYHEAEPENRELRLLQARLNWRSRDIQRRITAKVELQDLATATDECAVRALKDLAFLPPAQGMFKEDMQDAAERLLKHPMTNPASILHAADILMKPLDPAKRRDILAMVVHRLKEQDKVLLGHWLNRHGHHRLALASITEADASEHPELFPARFQALLATGQQEAAKKLLEAAPPDQSAASRAQAEAYLGQASGDASAIPSYIQWAGANNLPEALVDAGRFALLNKEINAAREAYATVLQDSPSSLGMDECTQLLQLALHARDSSLALTAAQSIHERNSHHPGHLNNLTWLRLLRDGDPVELLKAALFVAQTDPGNPSFQSTLALAHLLNKDPDAAIQSMRRRGGAPLQPAERAVLAAALFAQGSDAEARKWRMGINPRHMLPEEWALLEHYAPKVQQAQSKTGN